MPLSAALSIPSLNGKNASEDMTAPFTIKPSFFALRFAISALITRLICPAPMPIVCLFLTYTIAFDLTNFATVHANIKS